jgi:2-polyprenyl-3-methyl-5-hydroxy-6-metoxy-1,4-benzoquinol methylase
MKSKKLYCNYCKSTNYTSLNTYKHFALVCSDCGNVSHFKKDKYLFEYLFPRSIAKKLLPTKAFLRLFSDKNDFIASEFYDTDAFGLMDKTEWRKSEVRQVLDQLNLVNFDPREKRILDVSGGPGMIGEELNALGGDVVVTEYAESQVKAMNDSLSVNSVKFDYLNDRISEVSSGKFDLIMVRSSIIFCPDLDGFVSELDAILNPGGIIFIESILPTLGEIFWWQQLEYKFPFIYSQETIEKTFNKSGFTLQHGYRDYGGYLGVKRRSYAELSKSIFTWMLEYPMLLGYFALNMFKKPAIDKSLGHKMITQFWIKGAQEKVEYVNYYQGDKNKSTTFGYEYNGYLKK